jgi:hypothetical protein
MGKARDEQDMREMVGNIRADMRATFEADVSLSCPARLSRFTSHVLRGDDGD